MHKCSLVSASRQVFSSICWFARQAAAPKLLSPATDQNSTIARRADGLYEFLKGGPSCQKPTAPKPCVPYTWGSDFGTEPGAVSSTNQHGQLGSLAGHGSDPNRHLALTLGHC